MCPTCRQNAPLVYRGVNAYCAACGAPRPPLADSSVNLAGQPSKVGGTVARVFGWTVLAVGWVFAMLLAGLVSLLGGGWTAFAVAAPIALVTSIVAWALLSGGRRLKRSGADAELAAKSQAVFAIARAKGGVLRAWDVAQALQITPAAGDDLLTRLAKEQPDHVRVDLDDEGNVLFRFPAVEWSGLPAGAQASSQADRRVRVEPPGPRARHAPGADASVRVEPRSVVEEQAQGEEAASIESPPSDRARAR